MKENVLHLFFENPKLDIIVHKSHIISYSTNGTDSMTGATVVGFVFVFVCLFVVVVVFFFVLFCLVVVYFQPLNFQHNSTESNI